MPSDVPEPEPTDEDEHDQYPDVDEPYHFLGRTQTGGHLVAKYQAKWRLVDEDTGDKIGKGFHAIDEWRRIRGEQYFLGKLGSMVYILDSNGTPLTDGHHEIQMDGHGNLAGKTGARKTSIHL